jgi:hypothetical protein
VYKHLHHEPFDETVSAWETPARGRMSTSNQAIPWIIFERDRDRFEKEFPSLRIRSVVAHNALLYILSGGMSWKAFAPVALYGFFERLDRWLCRAPRWAPLFQTIVLEKIPRP